MWGLGAKTGAEPESELKVVVIVTIRFVFKKQAFRKTKCQNWTKNDQVMPNLMFLCQSGIWPILCQLMAILAKLIDMDFKFILSGIYINYSIPKIIPKITKMAISQNPILPNCHSPKSLLLHFSMNLSETFRINVNMDFAHNNRGRFLILNFSDKFIKNVGEVGFLVNDTWAKWGFEIWPF